MCLIAVTYRSRGQVVGHAEMQFHSMAILTEWYCILNLLATRSGH
jgi:hypothetical protein